MTHTMSTATSKPPQLPQMSHLGTVRPIMQKPGQAVMLGQLMNQPITSGASVVTNAKTSGASLPLSAVSAPQGTFRIASQPTVLNASTYNRRLC